MGSRDNQEGSGTSTGTGQETARMAANQARRHAEASRAMQAKLQHQLHALASAEAEAAHAFAEKREQLARESQTIAQKLQLLQSSGPCPTVTQLTGQTLEMATLPPHLLPSAIHTGRTPDNDIQNQGLAMPPINAQGLAEPLNTAHQASAMPQQTATLSGAPRPEGAGRD